MFPRFSFSGEVNIATGYFDPVAVLINSLQGVIAMARFIKKKTLTKIFRKLSLVVVSGGRSGRPRIFWSNPTTGKLTFVACSPVDMKSNNLLNPRVAESFVFQICRVGAIADKNQFWKLEAELR
jgi:hypothetical protein